MVKAQKPKLKYEFVPYWGAFQIDPVLRRAQPLQDVENHAIETVLIAPDVAAAIKIKTEGGIALCWKTHSVKLMVKVEPSLAENTIMLPMYGRFAKVLGDFTGIQSIKSCEVKDV